MHVEIPQDQMMSKGINKHSRKLRAAKYKFRRRSLSFSDFPFHSVSIESRVLLVVPLLIWAHSMT